MKKLLAGLLVLAMVFSITACGKKSSDEASNDAPLDVLTKVWEKYEDDEKFAAGGGDANNMVMDGPGKYDISDVEGLDVQLGFPQSSAALIDDAASLVHMMNANTFTAGVYHLSDSNEVELFVEDLKDNIMNRQWMCGFPDTLIIVKVGDSTVVSAFGNADTIEIFQKKLLLVYEDAEVYCEESLS